MTEDVTLTEGGPNKGGERILACFKEGEILTLREVEPRGYPRMFEILERPELGVLSRGVLVKVVPGLEPPGTKKRPEQ